MEKCHHPFKMKPAKLRTHIQYEIVFETLPTSGITCSASIFSFAFSESETGLSSSDDQIHYKNIK